MYRGSIPLVALSLYSSDGQSAFLLRKKSLVRIQVGALLRTSRVLSRDPATKGEGLSNWMYSLKRGREEAKKCILVCANCHAEIYALERQAAGSNPARDITER